MKKIIAMLLVLCFCVGLCACNTSPAEEEKPTTAEIAQEYIDNGQLEEAYALLYNINNRTEDENALFERFSMFPAQKEIKHTNGMLQIELFNENGHRIELSKTWANGDWEKRTFTVNSNGDTLSYKIITSSGGWANQNNTFDNNGNIIAGDYESDSETQKTRYTYDKDGKKIKEVWMTRNFAKTTEYKYDTAGNLIEEIVTLNGAQYKYQYAYDAQGRRVSYASHSGLTINYAYDDSGYLVTETSYQNGKDSGCHTYTYDEYGNVLTDVYKNSNGQEDQTVYTYTYDSYGNITQVIKTESNGKTESTTISYQLIYN